MKPLFTIKPWILHIFVSLSILAGGLVSCAFGCLIIGIAYRSLRSGCAPTRPGLFQLPNRLMYKDVRSVSPFNYWINVLSHLVIGMLFMAMGLCVIFHPSFFQK
jgi:hypothetical protein